MCLSPKNRNPMSNKNYNGWKNYETWNVSLWLFNEEHLLTSVTEEAPDNPTNKEIEIALTRAMGEATPDGVWLDDSRIDWNEIGNAVREYLADSFDDTSNLFGCTLPNEARAEND